MSAAALAVAALVAGLPAGAMGRLGASAAPRLCQADVVRETCALLDASGGDRATPAALQEVFAATEGSVKAFWRDAGLPAEGGASCVDLCSKTTSLLKALGRRLPPRTDLGCYEDGSGTTACDLDLGPESIQSMATSASDVRPFSEDEEHRHDNQFAFKDDNEPVQAFSYSVDEVAVRVAQLFRIYPALDSQVRMEKSVGATSTPAQRELLARRLQQSRAYVNIALRTFPANKTANETVMFFGDQALTSRPSRTRIQTVLNSVNNVLSNATYVYPGPACSSNVYAYVYSCRGGSSREHDALGRYYLYLCDLFFTASSEQICTLVHEASHHSTACTDDVQYGKHGCKELAKTRPEDAMRNADSYGYFIREVAWTLGSD